MAHESGSRVFFGSPRQAQPIVVNVPGEACETWADNALEWCQELAGETTRYDAALDLAPADLARRRLCEGIRAWKRGQVETAIRPGSHVLIKSDKPTDGWTAYYGGRTASHQMRWYDRRGPLRLEHQIRPAPELKPYFASMVKMHGVALVWRSFSLRIKFPMPWYQQLLEGPTVNWTTPRREPSELLLALEHLEKQYGPSLWLMREAGIDLNTLGKRPMELGRDLRAKALRWAAQADEAGYDGDGIRRALGE